jgi:hypothetical protein
MVRRLPQSGQAVASLRKEDRVPASLVETCWPAVTAEALLPVKAPASDGSGDQHGSPAPRRLLHTGSG